MSKRFWKNKTVIITGHEGFLGSHLAKRLLFYGARVIGIDIKLKRSGNILEDGDYDKLESTKLNILNGAKLKKLVLTSGANYIFHVAAEALVGRCQDNPSRAFNTNVEGTWNLLEACRPSTTIQGIIVASSDKAYGIHNKLPYRESSRLNGSHPYDASKSCADLIAYTYFHSYQLPVAVTRCGNIYGPGDYNFSRLIPDAMKCAARNKTLLIRSDGKFTRDYIYIDDIVDGYLMLGQQMKSKKLGGEAFNFSNEKPISVLNLVKKIQKISGGKPGYKVLKQAKYEIRHQYLSAAKARRVLKWKPKYTLDKGLNKTLGWYKYHLT